MSDFRALLSLRGFVNAITFTARLATCAEGRVALASAAGYELRG